MSQFIEDPIREMFDFSTIEGVQQYIELVGTAKASPRIMAEADAGSHACQRILWNVALRIPQAQRAPHVQAYFEKYVEMSAKNGDPVAQYNWGQCLILRVDASNDSISMEELDYIKQAKQWYRASAALGYAPSKAALEDLECFDF